MLFSAAARPNNGGGLAPAEGELVSFFAVHPAACPKRIPRKMADQLL